MRRRLGPLLARHTANLQWRGDAFERTKGKGTSNRPGAAVQGPPPPSSAAPLKGCIAALAQAPDAETQRRCLMDLRQQGTPSSQPLLREAASLYHYLSSRDLGLIVQRAVAVGDWQMAMHVLEQGGASLAFPTAATVDGVFVRCAREGKPEVGLAILRKKLLGTHSSVSPNTEEVLLPTASAYHALLVACSRQGASDTAVQVLTHMKGAGRWPTEKSYAAAIEACVKPKQWRQAVALLKEMKEVGVFPDGLCFGHALEACCRGGQWHRVGQLLDNMAAKGLEASEGLFLDTILPALSRAGRWRECQDTLTRMKRQGLGVPVEAHHMAMLACGRAGQWQKAWEQLGKLQRTGPRPSLACLETVLESCAQMRRVAEAEALLADIRRSQKSKGDLPSLTSYRAMCQLYGKLGLRTEALQLWAEVRGVSTSNEKEDDLLAGCFQGVLAACHQAARWEDALALLLEQEETLLAGMSVETQTHCFALVLGACAKAGEWAPARDLLRRTPAPDEACYEAVLEACARAGGGKWKEALAVLQELQQAAAQGDKGLVLGAGNYQMAMWACLKAGEAQQVVDLMHEMTDRKGLVPNVRAYVTYLRALQQLGQWKESLQALGQARRQNVLLSRGSSAGSGQEALALGTVVQTCGRAGRWREVLALLTSLPPSHSALVADVGSSTLHTLLDVLLADGRPREAVAVMQGMAQEVGVVPTLASVNRLLEGLARSGDWVLCHELLLGAAQGMEARFGVRPEVSCFSVVMSTAAGAAAGRGAAAHDELLGLLPAMAARHGLQPDRVAYNVHANLHRRAGNWRDTLALLEDMRAKGTPDLAPDVFTYSTAMAACGEAGEWAQALSLLDEMRAAGVAPNLVCFTAAMAACGRAGQPEATLNLLAEMKAAGLAPTLQAYNTALWAVAKGPGNSGARCLALLEEMKAPGSKVQPDAHSLRIVEGLGTAAARQAVAALRAAAAAKEEAEEDEDGEERVHL